MASLAFALDWETDPELEEETDPELEEETDPELEEEAVSALEEETASTLEEAPSDPLLPAAFVPQAASESDITAQKTIPIIALSFLMVAPFHVGILHLL